MLNISGIKLPMIGEHLVGGNVYFVDSGASGANNGNLGVHPVNSPLATLAGGIAKCANDNGDFIVMMPGHAETPTATVTIDKSDVYIIGIGHGKNRPKFTFTMAATGDNFNITADDVTIDNIYSVASGATQTAIINVGAAQFTLKNSLIEQGANNLCAITLPATAINTLILNNEFNITANGPDLCIDCESATSAGTRVIGNYFNGMNDTNAWDTGCIYSNSASLEWLVKDNVIVYGTGLIQFTAATKGMIINNFLGEGTINDALDPGSCMCFNNLEADAVDETAAVWPTSTAAA